jgi:hypothetical protein
MSGKEHNSSEMGKQSAVSSQPVKIFKQGAGKAKSFSHEFCTNEHESGNHKTLPSLCFYFLVTLICVDSWQFVARISPSP